MKKILFTFVIVLYMAVCFSVVNAATAKLNGSVVKNIKTGTSVTDSSLTITMTENEVNHFKDSITITLDGAEWDYGESGEINSVISYEKVDASKIKLHIKTNDSMEKGYSAVIPLNCRITVVKSSVAATVNYGFSDVAESKVNFATGEISRAYLDGSVKEVEQGTIIYKKSGSSTCNNLKIRVTANDAVKTRDKIKVTLEGARFTEYEDYGRVTCDRGTVANFRKSADGLTLEIVYDSFTSDMKTSGYTLTLPLAVTVTGTGEIKAIVDFGDESVEQSTVVFARVDSGTVSAVAENPNSPIETANTVSSVTIQDNTLKGYNNNTKINVQLNQVFHFVQTPEIVGTGKFENLCKIELDKNDTQKAVITITGAVKSGETGTIKLVNPIIERSPNATNKFSTVEISFTTKNWSDYNVSAVIAKYTEGANSAPPLQITVQNPNAAAKKYSALNTITITDYGNRAYSAGAKIMLSFDNGYTVFKDGAMPTLKGTGKFENNCEFKIDENQAYILIPKSASQESSGTVIINNIVLERESTEAFEDGVKLTVSVDGDSSSSASAIVAKYSSIYDTAPNTTTTTEASTETTTSAPKENGNTVKFKIGDVNYSVNGEESKLLAAPYIKDSYTMLPMRAIANIVGISNDNISYAEGTATFTVSDSIKLVVTAGSSEYSVAGKNISASTSAEIINGTMFLPMRDLANAIGISNDKISFNGETKEITLIC